MTPPALALVVAAGANSPGLVEACGPKGSQSWLCSSVYRITGDQTAANVADALSKPLRIVFILVVAWLLVVLSRVLINRFVRHLSGGVERLSTLRPGIAIVDTSRISPERSARRAATIGAVLRSIAALLIWSVAVLTILDDLGVNLAPLLAGAGVAGLALGFGAQSLVRDFISGLFMLIEDQYGVGDVIDTGVATGTVEALTLRTTRLRDTEGVVWHVPNGEIRRVGNMSQQWARALVDVTIGYEADVARATDAITRAVAGVRSDPAIGRAILDDPEVLGLESVAPDRVVIRVAVRTRPQEHERVARALRARIKQTLDDEGITVPSA
ncbi:MAG TPA: mechanosensitive ion channel family protein [Acidimicrobiia bacterium]|nr:mechanosensitive ion channel family protein [Acidimicrobiia bacterium]